MLECIGLYCQTLRNQPKLTPLCVSFVSGFPGIRYYKLFDSQNEHKSSEDQKYALLKTFASLKQYNWNQIKKELNIGNINQQIQAEALPQTYFYIPKNQQDLDNKVEELKNDNPDSVEEITEYAVTQTKILSKEDKRYEQDTSLKKLEAIFIIIFISIWSICVLTLLYIDYFFGYKNISETVYLALLTTTIVEVFGLQWLVMAHLFPHRQ
ncbi:MAG: hypothetical protein IJ560_02405 [Alphaproteobacteria bacterium]|nr:hypothetical protein [Alphaproteobacteria bacterium]